MTGIHCYTSSIRPLQWSTTGKQLKMNALLLVKRSWASTVGPEQEPNCCSASSSLVMTGDFSVPGGRSAFENSRSCLVSFNLRRVWTSHMRSEWLERTRYRNNCSGATKVPWQSLRPGLCHTLWSLAFNVQRYWLQSGAYHMQLLRGMLAVGLG